MTLTSRTGLQISAGQKSAIRKFMPFYSFPLEMAMCSLQFDSRQGQCIKNTSIHTLNESIECQMLYDLSVSLQAFDSVCGRKLSKAGVSLLKPEPRLRGAADSVLNTVRTLPCHIIR